MGDTALTDSTASAPISFSGLSERIDSHDGQAVAAYLSNLAPGTRRTMEQSLRLVASILLNKPDEAGLALRVPWGLVRRHHMQAVRAALERTHRPSTINKVLSSIRGVLHEVWCAGGIHTESYRKAIDVRGIKNESLLRGRALSADELRKVVDACRRDSTIWGTRDAALIATCYGSGIRRSEASALLLENYDAATGAITVIGGKARRDRVTYVGSALRPYLHAWLAVRGAAPGPVFCPISPDGRIEAKPMSHQAVLMVMKRRAAEAGIAEFSPHDLRRSFVSDLLASGQADLSVCLQLCGHASVRTSARYDRRGENAKMKAVEALRIVVQP